MEPEYITRLLSGCAEVDDCWVRTRGICGGGYSQIRISGRLRRAHRVSYEYFRDDIPEGLQLDHLCQRPACVNPWYLEPVTNAENRRRAAARITHCPHGHAYADYAPLRHAISGARVCRPCYRAHDAAGKRRRSAQRRAKQ